MNKHAPTIKSMILQDLGYCCEWFFWKTFKRTGLIATRLGVNQRSVRQAKENYNNGQCICEDKPNCLKKAIKRNPLRPDR